MSSATGERQDVVYLLGWGQLALLLALFTQRMRRDVAVADLFPCPAISFAGGGVAVIFLIAAGLQLGVFFTELSIC